MAGSIVQSRESSASAGGANIGLAFNTNNAAHNVLWVVGHAGDNTSVATISDTLVNTYSAAIDALVDSNNNNKLTDFSVSDSLAGANTVTVAFTNTPGFRAIYISELTGVQNAANDGHKANSQASPGTGADAVTSTTASNSATAFMMGLSSNDANPTAPTKGTGFTLDINAWLMGGATNQATIEFKSGVAVASNAATFTAVTGTDNYNTLMTMFKEGAAAAGTPPLSPSVPSRRMVSWTRAVM